MKAVRLGNFRVVLGDQTVASNMDSRSAWHEFLSRCHRFPLDEKDVKLFHGDCLVAQQRARGAFVRKEVG